MSKRKLPQQQQQSEAVASAPINDQDRHLFASKLRDFHCSRKTPFLHAPVLLGRRVDFLRLYNTVLSLGGYKRVSDAEDWYRVLESLGFHKYCANAELAVRQVYQRFLEPFERHQTEDKDPHHPALTREDSNDDTDMARYKRTQSYADATTAASAYNLQNHLLPPHMREQWGLSCDLVEIDELALLEKSLLSGLPNEVDFAINACLLMSYQPGAFQLQFNARIAELLAAHAGVFDCGPRSYYSLMREWLRQNKANMLRFWFESVWESELRDLLRPDHIATAAAAPAAAEELQQTEGTEPIPEADPAWRLMNLTPDLSLRDLEGQRVVLIATALRNLALEERPNAIAMSRSPPVLRLLLLCAASRHSMLRHLALDTLVSMPLVLHSDRLAAAVRKLLQRCLGGQDRQLVVRGLELISCLASQPDNWDRLDSSTDTESADFLPDGLAESLSAWLLLKDLQVVLAALEATYRLSAVGGACALRLCSPCCELLRVLLSLLTFEASQVGSAGIVGIKIFQGANAAVSTASQPTPASSMEALMPPPPPPPHLQHPPPPNPLPLPHPHHPQVALVRPPHNQPHQQTLPPVPAELPAPPLQQHPPTPKDYAMWWLRSRRLVPPCQLRLGHVHADCTRSFGAQFPGAHFMPAPEFCTMMCQLGFTPAPEMTNGVSALISPASPHVPPATPPPPPFLATAAPIALENPVGSGKKSVSPSKAKKVKLSQQKQQKQEVEQQQQQQRTRRNSCSSVSSSDDSAAAAAATTTPASGGGGGGGQLMTAEQPQPLLQGSAAPVAPPAAAPQPTAAALAHEAVIERVLNRIRPSADAKARIQHHNQNNNHLPAAVANGHHPPPQQAVPQLQPQPTPPLPQRPLLNGASVSILPNGHQQLPQPQQQLIRIVPPTPPPQQSQSISPQKPPLGLLCEWDGCWYCGDTPARVLHHVYSRHLSLPDAPDQPATRCLWRGCDPSPRGPYSLLAHVQDCHCSDRALRASLQRRRAVALSPLADAAASDSSTTSPMFRLPEDAARHAIHRLAVRETASAAAAGSGASTGREGPVTKHIRLTSALALRNLLRHAQPAREFARGHLDSLAEVCLSGSEAAPIVAQCVCDLA